MVKGVGLQVRQKVFNLTKITALKGKNQGAVEVIVDDNWNMV